VSTTLYAEIVKAERNADGDLVVVGKATGPDLDLDQQICDPGWLAKAMPEWMSTGGNLREQHSSIAAGVATELSQEGDSWMVAGLIVDPVSARKVEKRVLKGYSIGIKNPRVVTDKAAPGGRIIGGSVVEVSLVDRPCNPTCTLTLAKAAKPGAADVVDEGRGLVKVEELTEATADELTIKVGGTVFTPADMAKLLGKKKKDDNKDNGGSDSDGGDGGDGSQDDDSGHGSSQGADAAAQNTKDDKKKAKAKAKADKKNAKQQASQDTGKAAGKTTESVLLAGLATHYGLTIKQAAAVPAYLRPAMLRMAADKGAMPPLKAGGKPRYPISDIQDLKDAIQAFGRGKPADRDQIKAHIKSEAKRLNRADLIPADWKTPGPDTTKASDDGQKHDPDQIAAVRDGLVTLINAELAELCDGEPELCDVEQLLRSLGLLMSWWSNEAAGGETDSPYTTGGTDMAYVALDATPDTTKSEEDTPPALDATKDAAPDETKTTTPDTPVAAVVDENRLTELVKSAVADATKAMAEKDSEERKTLVSELDKVKAELARVSALPEPGGPVLTRTHAQTSVSRLNDAERLRAQADALLAKATAAQSTDPRLAQGYRDRAQQLLQKAAA
jgi:hypothetical protein